MIFKSKNQGAKIRHFIFLFLIACLSLCSCPWIKNPVGPIQQENLVIKTEKASYSWEPDGTNLVIFVGGTLENKSTTTWYSDIGDGFGPPEQETLYIADNSGSRIEKFNPVDGTWSDSKIAVVMSEGIRVVPIKPGHIYQVSADLIIWDGRHETGKFRIRVDYFTQEKPEAGAVPRNVYSNSFEIK